MRLAMSKNILIGLAAVATMASTTLAAPTQLKFANTNAWGQRNSDGSPNSDSRGGGPFEVTPINQGDVQGLGTNGAAAGSYLTFCVELNEHIGNHTYNAARNTVAKNGGVGGGVNGEDPLDARTAFIYTAFLKGTLASKLAGASLGTFTVGDAFSGTALQEAIWVIENEIGGNTVTSSLASDIVALADAAVAQGGEWYGKGIGNVRILNLTDVNDGSAKQDQLILIPLPMSALLGLIGLVGVGYVSRRRMMA